MSNKKGPLILFLFILLLLAIAYFGKKFLFERQLKNTSDTSGIKEPLRWAGDGYLGYAFLQTIEIKKQLARKGIALQFTNDNGDYANRLEKFNNKEYDFIVLPINSYLEHGSQYKYPGVIVAGISESKGADAIVGFDDVMPNGKINDLNNSNLKIYYTPASPSSFLLDLTISDFALDELANNKTWRREASGSEEVFSFAKKAAKDRSVGDAFVMWEPEVSRAIKKLGMKKLWGSDKFAGYIIDVIVFHRDAVSHKPEVIKDFLSTYFRALNYYSTRGEERTKELGKITGLDEDIIESMTSNIDWYSLQENCTKLFDISVAVGMTSHDGLVNSIYACTDVMTRNRTLKNPISDPYLIINSSFLEQLKDNEVKSLSTDKNATPPVFTAISENDWLKLAEVGIMRINPITFQSGANILDYQGEEIVDKVSQMLINNYPNYRIAIRGHTGQGDEKANKALSLERANIVKQRLIAVHNIDPNRIIAQGMGATQPPAKKPGENPRAYFMRWARVEFVLLENNSL
jgi:outer membrane protein OmpA-like peptidoglycan-associated protein/ABC-type nitrate/sulfonate/bicarbonate transport system substrate-binding protein